jgi:toxin HigB-1
MKVIFTKTAAKTFKKLPHYILEKLIEWKEAVEYDGIEAIRKIPGYHDEPLKGKRKGQRSIRLSQQWRAIYEVHENQVIVYVMEVIPHDY